RRHAREGLGVVDRGRFTEQAKVGGKWRLEPRPAGFALQRLEQRGFLPAYVGPRANERVQIEVDSRAQNIPAQQPRRVSLLQCRLEARNRLAEGFAPKGVVTQRGGD